MHLIPSHTKYISVTRLHLLPLSLYHSTDVFLVLPILLYFFVLVGTCVALYLRRSSFSWYFSAHSLGTPLQFYTHFPWLLNVLVCIVHSSSLLCHCSLSKTYVALPLPNPSFTFTPLIRTPSDTRSIIHAFVSCIPFRSSLCHASISDTSASLLLPSLSNLALPSPPLQTHLSSFIPPHLPLPPLLCFPQRLFLQHHSPLSLAFLSHPHPFRHMHLSFISLDYII